MLDYNKETRQGYKSDNVAMIYKNKYESLSLSNLDSNIVAYAEKKSIKELLNKIRIENPTILDIPCGTGKLSKILLRKGSVMASDVSPNMIKFSKDSYVNGKFMGFSISDATKTGFKIESFDCVICLRLMQRVPKDVRVTMLQEFHNICKKYLIISFGYEDFLQNIKRNIIKRISGSDPVPCAQNIKNINIELQSNGWIIKEKRLILPFISSEILYLCEKNSDGL